MCGIIGYIGKASALPIILDGLQKLEYRGYDSAGIVIVGSKSLLYERAIGENKTRALSVLRARYHDQKLKITGGHSGLGHVRWATHGKVTVENAHPHTDSKEQIFVVHNGTIKNYQALKSWPMKNYPRVIFRSETDSEVIAHLIAFHLKDHTFEEACRQAVLMLEGDYAVAVVNRRMPHRLLIACHYKSLYVGHGPDGYVVASDLAAFPSTIQDYIQIPDNVLGQVMLTEAMFMYFDGTHCQLEPETFAVRSFTAEKGKAAHFMLKEINEQHQVINNVVAYDVQPFSQAREVILQAQRVVLVGSGTSYHAALIGKHYLESITDSLIDVQLSSEANLERLPSSSVVVALSQSGETADTLTAIRQARERNAKIITLVNVAHSTMARHADIVLPICAGPEYAVASTKAFIGQLVALLRLTDCQRWQYDDKPTLWAELLAFSHLYPSYMRQWWHKDIMRLAKKYQSMRLFVFLGRGLLYPVAHEAALKLCEVSYVPALARAAGELKHGPLAVVDERTLAIVLVPSDQYYERNLTTLSEIKSRHGKILAITDSEDTRLNELVDDRIKIPLTSYEELSPIMSVIPLQLFAYYFAVRRGLDPDHPRHLAKSVTVE